MMMMMMKNGNIFIQSQYTDFWKFNMADFHGK